MFLNQIGYTKQQNIKISSTKSHSRSRKKSALRFKKSLHFSEILTKVKTALNHPEFKMYPELC